MAKLAEPVRQFIIDAEKFLGKTIKDVKLTSSANSQKAALLNKIKDFRQQYDQLRQESPPAQPAANARSESTSDIKKDAVFSGYLTKVKEKAKAKPISKVSFGTKKWAAVRGTSLYLYDKQSSKKHIQDIPLLGSTCSIVTENKSKLVFHIKCPTESFYFAATSQADLTLWLESLGNATVVAHKGTIGGGDDDDEEEGEAIYEDDLRAENEYEVDDDDDDDDDHVKVSASSSEVKDGSYMEDDTYDQAADKVYDTADDIYDEAREGGNDMDEDEDEDIYDEAFSGQARPRVPPNAYADIYYGRWAYEAADDQELTFARGDELAVVSKQFDDDGWWLVQKGFGEGMVPKQWLTPAYQLVVVEG